VWLLWVGFNALVLVIYPTVIAPLFNRFEPLKDSAWPSASARCCRAPGFVEQGRVRDGRLAPFGARQCILTGLGRAKRIVFFDTLVDRLQPAEIGGGPGLTSWATSSSGTSPSACVLVCRQPRRPRLCSAGWPTAHGSTRGSA